MIISLVESSPKEKESQEITKAYMKILENYISEKPENWLWLHKRWKKKKPEGMKID